MKKFAFILLLIPSLAFASELPTWVESIGAWLAPMIGGLAGQFPVLTTVVFVVGGLRVVFKPIVAGARAYVTYTTNPEDDRILDRVESSTAFKVVAFVLDWFTSIKITPVAKK